MSKRGRTEYQTGFRRFYLLSDYGNQKNFVKTKLKYFFQDKFYQGLLNFLRNLGCNNNLIKNQKVLIILQETYEETVQETPFLREKKNKTE